MQNRIFVSYPLSSARLNAANPGLKLNRASTPLFLVALMIALISFVSSQAQEQSPDVVRVNTELVQTAVTVVDRKGKIVTGLTKDQFQLRVDGKSTPINFLEQVLAGTFKEQQLASKPGAKEVKVESGAVYRGRTIVFFIDDLHLQLQSLDRTRKMLLNFIEKEMTARDQVVIATASGQLGFLEQFTSNKEVLTTAASRLMHRPYVVSGYGTGKTTMTEYVALTIESRSDDKVGEFYVEECMKQTSLPKKTAALMRSIRETCKTQVTNSARAILMQAGNITRATYGSLEFLMQSSARRPGRKLAFFLSDGFLLDVGISASLSDQLTRIIDSAQRSGVVVYTIDARGLVSGQLDATNNVPADPNGRLQTLSTKEIAAMQDALHALAVDTGGRALRNQNVFDRWVGEVLEETSNYYLLAWRPESEAQKEKKFRKVEVSIAGRPDLSVRLPKGYIEGSKLASAEVAATDKSKSPTQLTPARILGDTLTDHYSRNEFPVTLALSFINTPANGMVLTSSAQISSSALLFGDGGKKNASVDLAGVVLNDKQKIVTSFKTKLGVNSSAQENSAEQGSLIYNHRVPLGAGIYQVRVAVRDEFSGRVGSAMEWVVVPDVAAQKLTLSSLLLDGKVVATKSGATDPQIQFSVDHRFGRNSHLSFWVFIYNAMRANAAPNLTAQVQVLRNGKPVVTTKEQALAMKGITDTARIPYGGDMTLNNLMAGYYELKITISDLAAKTTASQTIGFEVQ